MECDVIPDCSQEVDPLGNLVNCDSLSADTHVFALDAQIVSSTDSTYHVQPPAISPSRPPPHPSLGAKSSASVDNVKSYANTASLAASARRKTTKPNITTAKKKQPRTQKLLDTLHHAPSSDKTSTLSASTSTASTMREVLASIPGFSIKPRRRTSKKMSTAAQIAQTREGCIDLETPDSILVGANLRSLLNKHTFLMLPPLFQYKLVQLLPGVDRPSIDPDPNAGIRLNASSLNNEFFARACLEWRDRLSEGEFTPENQMKLRADAEKEKSRLDPWKLKHFEPIWGRDKNHHLNLTSNSTSSEHDNFEIAANSSCADAAESVKSSAASTSISTPSYTTISGRTVRNPTTFNSVSSTAQKRSPRTVGAMTRASAAAVVYQSPSDPTDNTPQPELLPLRTKTPRQVDMNVPEHPVAVRDTAELPVTCIDGIDTIIIPDDEPPVIPVTSSVTVTISNTSLPSIAAATKPLIPTAYTIPPGIEVIPLDSNQSSNSSKRAQKRSNSPDRNQIKISKYSDDTRSPNHTRPALHHRSPIPSKPSPNHSSQNGTCAVSDVIQIIKLPDVSAQQHAAGDKPSNEKPWTSMAESVPSMSVAVTTIAAHVKEQQQPSSSNPPPSAQVIELIKRPKPPHPPSSLPSSNPPSAMYVSSFPSLLRPNKTPPPGESPADTIKLDIALPIDLPLNAVVDSLDNDLDVDEANIAESPADHVFRAMVCHGDDVLCGDGSVTAHPDLVAEPSKSNMFYDRDFDNGAETADIAASDVINDTTTVNADDELSNAAGEDESVDLTMSEDQCDGGIDSAVVEAAVEELEPSIQSLDPLVELDPIEQEFNDAENYVLESGEISADSVGKLQ